MSEEKQACVSCGTLVPEHTIYPFDECPPSCELSAQWRAEYESNERLNARVVELEEALERQKKITQAFKDGMTTAQKQIGSWEEFGELQSRIDSALELLDDRWSHEEGCSFSNERSWDYCDCFERSIRAALKGGDDG